MGDWGAAVGGAAQAGASIASTALTVNAAKEARKQSLAAGQTASSGIQNAGQQAGQDYEPYAQAGTQQFENMASNPAYTSSDNTNVNNAQSWLWAGGQDKQQGMNALNSASYDAGQAGNWLINSSIDKQGASDNLSAAQNLLSNAGSNTAQSNNWLWAEGHDKVAAANAYDQSMGSVNQANYANNVAGNLNATGTNSLASQSGILDTLKNGINEQTLQNTPGYQFNLAQGEQAATNSAAARGLANSGAALKGAAQYATGLADSTYQNQYNTLLNTANAYGQNAQGYQQASTTNQGVANQFDAQAAAQQGAGAGYNAYAATDGNIASGYANNANAQTAQAAGYQNNAQGYLGVAGTDQNIASGFNNVAGINQNNAAGWNTVSQNDQGLANNYLNVNNAQQGNLQNQFNRQNTLANYGSTAVANQAQNTFNTGLQSNNALLEGANGAMAGTIAEGNALQTGLTNLGNQAGNYAYNQAATNYLNYKNALSATNTGKPYTGASSWSSAEDQDGDSW